MLTGCRLFEGETVTHTLAGVRRGPIDVDALPGETPSGIRPGVASIPFLW